MFVQTLMPCVELQVEAELVYTGALRNTGKLLDCVHNVTVTGSPSGWRPNDSSGSYCQGKLPAPAANAMAAVPTNSVRSAERTA